MIPSKLIITSTHYNTSPSPEITWISATAFTMISKFYRSQCTLWVGTERAEGAESSRYIIWDLQSWNITATLPCNHTLQSWQQKCWNIDWKCYELTSSSFHPHFPNRIRLEKKQQISTVILKSKFTRILKKKNEKHVWMLNWVKNMKKALSFCELSMPLKTHHVPWKVWPVSKPESTHYTSLNLSDPWKSHSTTFHFDSSEL